MEQTQVVPAGPVPPPAQPVNGRRARRFARRPSRREVVLLTLLVAYVAITLGVIYRSPLLTLDQDVLKLDLRQHYPQLWHWLHTYVMLGQRGPATVVALPWFVWRAWKSRSPRPLIMLGAALLALNLSVGVVKLATGRLGPRATHQVHAVFEGGDIFPSGHVSNAVVLYGVIAMLAVNWRRTAAIAAAFISLTVGLTTIYLDTHWLSDVVGGWLAGGLVLVVLPWLMPFGERAWDAGVRTLRRLWHRGQPEPGPSSATPPPVEPLLVDVSATGARISPAGQEAGAASVRRSDHRPRHRRVPVSADN